MKDTIYNLVLILACKFTIIGIGLYDKKDTKIL
jgi:hypothetical protein